MANKEDKLRGIVKAKTLNSMAGKMSAKAELQDRLEGRIIGKEELQNHLQGKMKGKTLNSLQGEVKAKTFDTLNGKIAEYIFPGRRLSLFDRLDLRDSDVYPAPRDISTLQIVFGDLRDSKVPCTALDQDGYVYHVSDYPIEQIFNVYVDNEQVTGGFLTYDISSNRSYTDLSGRGISCIVFDKPQFNASVYCTCKGVIKKTNGALIQNPADIIEFVFFNIQEYDKNVLDTREHSEFQKDSQKKQIKLDLILDEKITIKEFLDSIATEINAFWRISDGKSIMKYRWLYELVS